MANQRTLNVPGRVPELTLGMRIEVALRDAKVGKQELADHLGVERGSVSRWVNDRGPVRDVYLRQIALITGVDYRWLRYGEIDLTGGPGTPGEQGGPSTTWKNAPLGRSAHLASVPDAA